MVRSTGTSRKPYTRSRRSDMAYSRPVVHSSYLKGEEPRQLLEKRMREEGRLPPGQSASLKWPVLHVGADPVFDAATWHFKTGGLVEAPLTLNWSQMSALPRVDIVHRLPLRDPLEHVRQSLGRRAHPRGPGKGEADIGGHPRDGGGAQGRPALRLLDEPSAG